MIIFRIFSVQETVSDFQRERLNERDSSMATTAVTHSTAPSTSEEHEITTCTVLASTSTGIFYHQFILG